MNRIMKETYPLFTYYQALRSQLLDILDDGDLDFSPGGLNPPLGALCKEIGETQQAYINSFRSGRLVFDVRAEDPELSRRVGRLRAWYTSLDEQLRAAVAGYSDEELAEARIDRGGDFFVPIRVNLIIYQEALLIFYGKVSVYLKAMDRSAPEQWQEWIA